MDEKKQELNTLFQLGRFLLIIGFITYSVATIFNVNNGYWIVLGMVFLVMGILSLIRHNRLSVTIEIKKIGKDENGV